jgi:hypothetical protein
MFQTRRVQNFLIVGTHRIGSGVIGQSLSFHPEVTCGWEWTAKVRWDKKIEVAERAMSGDFSMLSMDHQNHMSKVFNSMQAWLGFRRPFGASDRWLLHPRFAPHIILDRLEAHLRWLNRRTDIRIIHIVRRDNIAWLKSAYLSKITGFYVEQPYPEELKIRIPVRRALARLCVKDWIDKRLLLLKRTNRYLQISYDDFLKDPDETTALGLKFLDCDPAIVIKGKRQRKQSTKNAQDYIVNCNELRLELSNRNLLNSQFDRTITGP